MSASYLCPEMSEKVLASDALAAPGPVSSKDVMSNSPKGLTIHPFILLVSLIVQPEYMPPFIVLFSRTRFSQGRNLKRVLEICLQWLHFASYKSTLLSILRSHFYWAFKYLSSFLNPYCGIATVNTKTLGSKYHHTDVPHRQSRRPPGDASKARHPSPGLKFLVHHLLRRPHCS